MNQFVHTQPLLRIFFESDHETVENDHHHQDQDDPHLDDQYHQGAQTDVGGGGVMGGPVLGAGCKKRNRYIIATIANIVSIKYIIVTIANIIGRKYMKQFLGTSWVGHVAVHSWALSS